MTFMLYIKKNTAISAPLCSGWNHVSSFLLTLVFVPCLYGKVRGRARQRYVRHLRQMLSLLVDGGWQ